MNYITEEKIHAFIDSALQEDIGEGDHTSLASIPPESVSKARLLVKDNGILAGVELAEKIFLQADSSLKIDVLIKDGERVKVGETAFVVEGGVHSILKTERLVLNCMQRMSGIATFTDKLKSLIEGTGARLLDTRKTTPNFRMMEKWAVAIGGGTNHRFGLYDMILLKDNHVDYAGGIQKAIEATLHYLQSTGKELKIEIETRNLKEVEEVLKTGGVQRIMLDNMSTEDMEKAVKMIDSRYETEASGNINENTIRKVAETGVDFISVGALTHSVKSLDLSLKAF